eukprot:TRINITY_DN1439_c0_g1_i3.p1 TRINITY_DN1439_c0_g1~~TRINITY_DN1439_c0_g1_i3.p1  ORF type:complete len:306 (+),score=74.46 TRINITY_DN1439_c0_g1_i3:124-1041(+)
MIKNMFRRDPQSGFLMGEIRSNLGLLTRKESAIWANRFTPVMNCPLEVVEEAGLWENGTFYNPQTTIGAWIQARLTLHGLECFEYSQAELLMPLQQYITGQPVFPPLAPVPPPLVALAAPPPPPPPAPIMIDLTLDSDEEDDILEVTSSTIGFLALDNYSSATSSSSTAAASTSSESLDSFAPLDFASSTSPVDPSSLDFDPEIINRTATSALSSTSSSTPSNPFELDFNPTSSPLYDPFELDFPSTPFSPTSTSTSSAVSFPFGSSTAVHSSASSADASSSLKRKRQDPEDQYVNYFLNSRFKN